MASAAPCTTGSLESYTTLGAGGCNIGGVQFTTFNLLSVSFTEIDPTTVILNPTGVPGFTVDFNATAGPGQTLESTFSFMASGAPFQTGFVGLSGSSVTPDGANTAIATFTPGATAIAFDIGSDSQLTDSTSINANSVLIELDYVIDGGGSGGASLTQGTVGLLAAPEPSSMLLTFSGLAGLALTGRRRVSDFFRRQQ